MPFGPYEQQLDGIPHFAVDPVSPFNRGITDLHLAPRDDNSLDVWLAMSASSACRLPTRQWSPLTRRAEPGKPIGTVDVQSRPTARWIPRARRDPGNGFLMRQGYTIVWCGCSTTSRRSTGSCASVSQKRRALTAPSPGRSLVRFPTRTRVRSSCSSDRLHRPIRCSISTTQTTATASSRAKPDDAPPQVTSPYAVVLCEA